MCKLRAILKFFTTHLSCFRAIIKFRDKIYTPGISKLTLIFGFDEELTEIFEVEDKAKFPKSQ